MKNSDELVFRQIFNDHHEKVYFYILTKTNSVYLAEEVTQLTFIKLWNYRHHLDSSLPLSAQIFRIAKTSCIDLIRKEAAKKRLPVPVHGSGSFSNDVSEYMEKQELEKKLIREVERMPPVRRKIFELSRFHMKSHKQIAEELSLSYKTVEHHMALALKHLRRVLFSVLFNFL